MIDKQGWEIQLLRCFFTKNDIICSMGIGTNYDGQSCQIEFFLFLSLGKQNSINTRYSNFIFFIFRLDHEGNVFTTFDLILVGVICLCCASALVALFGLVCCRWRCSTKRDHIPLPDAWQSTNWGSMTVSWRNDVALFQSSVFYTCHIWLSVYLLLLRNLRHSLIFCAF